MTIPILLNNAIQSILKRIPTGDQLDLMNMAEEQLRLALILAWEWTIEMS